MSLVVRFVVNKYKTKIKKSIGVFHHLAVAVFFIILLLFLSVFIGVVVEI